MSYKPDGYPDIAPYLIVRDGKVALDFLRATFDCDVRRQYLTDAGRVRHAEVAIGDSLIMLGEGKDPVGAHVHLYLPDPERAIARARAAGGVVVQEITRKEDGDKRGGVRAPCGTTYWLAAIG